MRTPHSCSVAGHEYSAEGRLRVVVPDDREASRAGVPAMLAPEEARELGRGVEAVPHAHRIHLEGPLTPRDDVAVRLDASEDGSPHALVVTLCPHEYVPVEHWNAAARESGPVRDPPPDESRRVAERGEGRPRAGVRGRSRLRNRRHFHPSRRELARHLEIERPVARDEDPRAGRDPVGTRQRLGRPRGHDAGKGPAGNGMRPLVRTGSDDELARAKAPRAPAREDLHLRRRRTRNVAGSGVPACVGAPHRGGADDLHFEGANPFDEGGPGFELPILRAGRGEAVARRELLEVLATRLGSLVENRHGHTGAGGGLGRGEPGRAGPDDDEVALRLRQPVDGRRNEGSRLFDRDGRPVVAMGGNRHAVPHPRHARPLPRAAVHRHQALVADPHAAEDAARLPASRTAQGFDSRRGQGGGHRLTLDCRYRSAFEVDRDGRSGRNDSRGSKAEGARRVVSHRGLTVHRSAGGAGSDRRTGRPPCSLRTATGVGVGPGRR